MKIGQKRDLPTLLKIAITMTIATTRRLLLSKKTAGIVILCLIPIIIFSLWSVDAFPKDEEEHFAAHWALLPDLGLNATDSNISVTIETWTLDGDNFYLNGKTTGPVDHMTIKIVFFFTQSQEFIQPLNLTKAHLNSTADGALRGPTDFAGGVFEGKGSGGEDDWGNWGLYWESMIPFSTITSGSEYSQLLKYLEDYDIDAPRISIYVRAFSDNSTTEQNWNYDYMELYLKFEETEVIIGEVGKDVEAIELEEDGYEVFMEVAPTLFFLFIIPLITILYAISAVRDDIENHTIVYLITRPISKTEIILYKFKGFFVSALIPIAISICISFFIVAFKEGSPTAHLDYIGNLLILIALNILAYGAIFFVFATITSYPIVISLLYVFFWETLVANLPNVINRFSVTFHINSMADDMLGEIANVNTYEAFGATSSFIILVLIIALFLLTAIYIFNFRDFA